MQLSASPFCCKRLLRHYIEALHFILYNFLLNVGNTRVRIFSAHNNWWATAVVILPFAVLKPHARTYFSDFLRQGVETIREDNVYSCG